MSHHPDTHTETHTETHTAGAVEHSTRLAFIRLDQSVSQFSYYWFLMSQIVYPEGDISCSPTAMSIPSTPSTLSSISIICPKHGSNHAFLIVEQKVFSSDCFLHSCWQRFSKALHDMVSSNWWFTHKSRLVMREVFKDIPRHLLWCVDHRYSCKHQIFSRPQKNRINCLNVIL